MTSPGPVDGGVVYHQELRDSMDLESIQFRNFLSFRDPPPLELRRLNVLIGPNGSGKSNLVEGLGLLQAAPRDFGNAIRFGGPVSEWIWHGEKAVQTGSLLQCVLGGERPLTYEIRFGAAGQALEITGELLRLTYPKPFDPESYFSRRGNRLDFGVKQSAGRDRIPKSVSLPSADRSALEALKGPLGLMEAAELSGYLDGFRIFRKWETASKADIRQGAGRDASGDYISETGHNLALVLNNIDGSPERSKIEEYLGKLLEGFRRLFTRIENGVVRVHLSEEGMREEIPASRLSDGTLRYLCLMTVLFHPRPPSLICIEEPEVGLHPDALQLVAEALVEASERVQIIVTTHSDVLVDALSAEPESIVVCEKDFDHSTNFKRLDSEQLKTWLDRYRLGEIWRKGVIGGNRW